MVNLLIPAYQPIVDLLTGEVSHWEALARITEDESESAHVPLIQLAERHRFIHKIDLAMVQLTAADSYLHTHAVAINLSPYTIEVSATEILALLSAHPDFVGRLIIEITESLAIANLNRLQRFMAEVRELGARVALDDYGRGCFTERLVRTLEPDFLKLAGEMVHRVTHAQDSIELHCAHQLVSGFKGHLIAEHIDSEVKHTFMQAHHVRFGQGERFGMPTRTLPGATIANWPCRLVDTDLSSRANQSARAAHTAGREVPGHAGNYL